MWTSEHLPEHDLTEATPLLAAVAPAELAGFPQAVREWIQTSGNGAMLVRAEGGCIVALALFRPLAKPRAFGINWLRHIEIGRPEAMVAALLDAFLDTARKEGFNSVWIAGEASNSRTFSQHVDGHPGTACGFRPFAGGWISQLPEFASVLGMSPVPGP
ncbi:MAG: hypothetical protein R3C97_06120 [Geminicoccaceae bacterium]